MHGLYSFAVITDDRELLLAASSEEEKYKWMEVRFKKAGPYSRGRGNAACFRVQN